MVCFGCSCSLFQLLYLSFYTLRCFCFFFLKSRILSFGFFQNTRLERKGRNMKTNGFFFLWRHSNSHCTHTYSTGSLRPLQPKNNSLDPSGLFHHLAPKFPQHPLIRHPVPARTVNCDLLKHLSQFHNVGSDRA